jgi:hypothetical protein
LTLFAAFAARRANRISAGGDLSAQFNCAAFAGDVIAPACGGLNAPRDDTAFRQRRPYARTASEKSNHKNPKDKIPRVAIKGRVVVGGQPVGIAQAAELTSPDIDKDLLNLS